MKAKAMTRSYRRVYQTEYRAVLKELRAICASYGAKLVVRKRPVTYQDGPTRGHVYGYFNPIDKVASVVYRGNASRSHILKVAAHETRHAIHSGSGLYSSYYNGPTNEAAQFLYMRKPATGTMVLPNLFVAIRAELDCDRWSHKFLAKKGLGFRQDHPYRFTDTMAYKLHRDWIGKYGLENYLCYCGDNYYEPIAKRYCQTNGLTGRTNV